MKLKIDEFDDTLCLYVNNKIYFISSGLFGDAVLEEVVSSYNLAGEFL